MELCDLESRLKALHDESFAWARVCCAGPAADAEDVLQTVYLLIIQGKARYGEQADFKTWLFAVIRNQSAKEARRQMIRRLFLLRPENEQPSRPRALPPDASLEKAERAHAFQAALDALPRRQREVLHLVFYEDLTIAEAARVMGVSLGSARQHYERGKAKLRRDFSL